MNDFKFPSCLRVVFMVVVQSTNFNLYLINHKKFIPKFRFKKIIHVECVFHSLLFGKLQKMFKKIMDSI